MESTTVSVRFLQAQPEETLVREKHLRFQIGEQGRVSKEQVQIQ